MSSTVVNCGLEGRQFYLSKVSAGLGTLSAAAVSVFYGSNVCSLIYRGYRQRHPLNQHVPPRLPPRRRFVAPVNPLSALLASVVTVILIVAIGHTVALPQPLESTALLVVMLAQASVLGLQDHDPKNRLCGLVEKLADVAAVVLAAYALSDARDKYIEATQNSFNTLHDPDAQVVIAYVLSGIGCAAGLAQLLLLALRGKWRWQRKHVLRTISPVFFIIQAVTASVSIRYGASTISDGCAIFNATKIVAMVALGLGILYSLAMTIARCLSLPLADDDDDADDDNDKDDGDGDDNAHHAASGNDEESAMSPPHAGRVNGEFEMTDHTTTT